MGFTVDRDRCVGSAYCQGIAPTVFDVDDVGLAFVLDGDPSGEALDAARRAAEACPSRSIRERTEPDINAG
jgi:ferredoxin